MPLVPVKFKETYANGKVEHMVLLAPSGDSHTKTQTWHRVSKLIPPENMTDAEAGSDSRIAMAARWSAIEPHYEAWKKGVEVPDDGTPLSVWAGVSAEQVELLKKYGIRTVEGVRDMSDSMLPNLPFPKARDLPKLAAQFLEGRDAAEKDAQIAAQQERMENLEQLVAELTAAQSAEKPKRGRPRKTEAA